MKKHYIFASLFCLFYLTADAQDEKKSKADDSVSKNTNKKTEHVISGDERRGDKHFYNFSYSTALEYYMDALEKDSTQILKLKIAECYKMLNDYLNADDWYHKGLNEHGADVDPKYKLHFAQALSTEQKYEEAKEWYEEYRRDMGSDSRAAKKLEGLNDMGRFFKDSAYYQIKEVSVNSVGLDFSPMWYDEGVLFVSSRTNKPFSKTVFNWDESSYLDLYYSKIKPDGDLDEPRIFHKKVNTKYHEGPLSFYNDQHNVVFTRNNYFKGKAKQSSDGVTKLKLYFADRKKNDKGDEDDWVNIRPFEFNNDEYSIGHPSITSDGKKMVFASDMPGGYGGTDIYITHFENGAWTTPKNLGPTINTEGMEVFPYLNGDFLYLSSDGHGGLGGLDLYRATMFNDEAIEFKNLGHPMSSSFDDFSLIITEDDHYGYFATNRDDTVYDNIYYFVYDKPGDIFVRGKVVNNQDDTPIASSVVELRDSKGEVLKDTLSDPDGNYEFRLNYKRHYKLVADKKGYIRVNTDSVYTAKANDVIEDRILKLKPMKFVISMKPVDNVSREPIEGATVHCVNKKTKDLVSLTNRAGHNYDFVATPGNTFRMAGIKVGYFSNTIEEYIDYNEVRDTLFFEIPMEKIEIGKAIELENIYYDLDKSYIRSDAAVELDKLVTTLKENPTIKIELGSHTDSRGSDGYNLSLSQRRATAAVDYIVGKGVSSTRIVAKGYGETKLVNKCSNGVTCSKEEHQRNRRTEFKVTSY